MVAQSPPACGDNIQDLVGCPKAGGGTTDFEQPPRLIISLVVCSANPFVSDEFSNRSGYSLGRAIGPKQLTDKWPAEKKVDEIDLPDSEDPIQKCLGEPVRERQSRRRRAQPCWRRKRRIWPRAGG